MNRRPLPCRGSALPLSYAPVSTSKPVIESRHRPTLPPGDPAVPWLRGGFTSVFGMGTGVSPLPWAPALEGGSRDEYEPKFRVEGFMRLNQVKPHGRLVPVGFTCCHASTPGLSNRWSTCDLQGHKVREIALRRGFPLRCFQRLSLPNIATRRCSWRNNRITRGSSTPVLSY